MLKTFSIGGVHPHENKLSAHQPIIKAEIPAKAAILLGQHIGAPAKPIVAKGDVVKVGTKIAEPGGFVSAAIHSSVSGKVAKIDTIVDASGYAKPAIFIDVEGDEWEESIDRSETLVKECSLTSEEIVKKIADAGIVGLGGACFPTQVKLCPPPAFKAECVIINAVECEPYLTADHQLMLEHAEEIMVGVSILMKAVKVNKAFIGIENNKPDAIQLMTKVASSYAGIEVVPLKVQYPQGGEKQLIDAVISRQVAAGALPISTGAVVQNVGTAFAVYQAVQKNKPLFERVITVTGKSLAKPSNFLARIGTPMKQLIEACGGLPEDTGKIIGGGPMMGKALVNTDVPTAKGSSGILIMNEKEAKRGEVQPCIRCAKCVGACPMGLEPYLLANGIQFSRNTPDMTAASSIRQANRGDYDFYLALHSNASGPGSQGQNRGIIAFYYPTSANGRRGAEIIARNMQEIYPLPERVVTRSTTTLGEVRQPRAPAVLVEIGYHDNEADARWIESHIDAIGQNLAMSMAEYFGLPFTYPGPSQPGVIVTESGGPVNLRAEPSVTGRVLTRIPSGETVTVFGQYRGWYVVLYGDTLGYVSAPYVQI